MIQTKITVINKLGLHARAATKLANLTNRYGCKISAGLDRVTVDAKSVMSLMLLAASKGTELIFEFEGDDQQEAQDAVTALFADYFGEGE
ncbi:HPr family phosphocarrier protein [Porticoccaceae bacterium]|nr:HPr family phosphocarrier protein [Porticoccaceae bacterium]MDC0494638.1 HPr family phosphocarrier protein [bacterium]MDA8651097.1 HPr family phosphocarrier protein [Porticoccaceae bacterium]MDB2344371.1 HPr family phosphocarrier protein [Porticoccaceae bacterium]MDB2634563.1 HPr family phosphocarrier protein [Porticoccaceae bacterium]